MSPAEFDHIAIAVEKIAAVPAFLVGVLGGSPAYGADTDAFRFGQWRFAGGGRIEILEPRGARAFLHRFLDQHGPGVHHVTFKVPDLDEACGRARAHGFDVVGYDTSDPTWKEAFLHPRQALGIVVQLAEGSGELPGWKFPPAPPDPPPAVRLLGLRTRARSRERAITLWTTVLGGLTRDGAANELVFEWPGSPMQIVAEIGAEGGEGPVAVEFSADRHIALPNGPHAVLGGVFAQRPI